MRKRRTGAATVLAAALLAACGGAAARETAPSAPSSTTTDVTMKLPVVGVAETAACLAEARVIETAEDTFATLNGRVATLDELVAAGSFREPPTRYASVRIGVPPGGYTLIGVPGTCGNFPVIGR